MEAIFLQGKDQAELTEIFCRLPAAESGRCSSASALADDSEFTAPGNQGGANHNDLLTALEHELGHILGCDHTDTGLMNETLASDTRLTPAEMDFLFASV